MKNNIKKHLKTYLKSVLISIVLTGLPWLMGHIGLLQLLDVLGLYALIGAVLALIISSIYIL